MRIHRERNWGNMLENGNNAKPWTISSHPMEREKKKKKEKKRFSSQVPRCHALPLQEMEKRALTGEAAPEIKISLQINACFFTADVR